MPKGRPFTQTLPPSFLSRVRKGREPDYVRPRLSMIIHTGQHILTTEGPTNTIFAPISTPEQLLSIKHFKRTCYFVSVSGAPPITDGNLSIIDHPHLTSSTHNIKHHFNYRPDWTEVLVTSCTNNPTTPLYESQSSTTSI